ncbi:MAG TPA: helix-turn-helix transcriptional regulator [Lachnospiraceae bacterium]|nr:helix-turn-helix transcriptional regulator [Lachnospiraceae bacterium]
MAIPVLYFCSSMTRSPRCCGARFSGSSTKSHPGKRAFLCLNTALFKTVSSSFLLVVISCYTTTISGMRQDKYRVFYNYPYNSVMAKETSKQRKPLYVALGKNIASFRKDLALSQTDLASQIGMSQQYLAAIEVGERRIQIEELIRICDILHVAINELLPIQKATKKPGPRPKIAVAYEKLVALPEKEQNAVMVMIDSLASVNHLNE